MKVADLFSVIFRVSHTPHSMSTGQSSEETDVFGFGVLDLIRAVTRN